MSNLSTSSISSNIFVEFDFEFDFFKPTSENINNLIKAIKRKKSQESTIFKYIVLLDEVEIWEDHYDLTDLDLQEKDVDILIAISPSSQFCKKPYNVKLPKHSNSVIERLRFMHRYSTEICRFLLHNIKYANFKNERQNISSEDVSLQESTFPNGRRPILFITAKHTDLGTLICTILKQLPCIIFCKYNEN